MIEKFSRTSERKWEYYQLWRREWNLTWALVNSKEYDVLPPKTSFKTLLLSTEYWLRHSFPQFLWILSVEAPIIALSEKDYTHILLVPFSLLFLSLVNISMQNLGFSLDWVHYWRNISLLVLPIGSMILKLHYNSWDHHHICVPLLTEISLWMHNYSLLFHCRHMSDFLSSSVSQWIVRLFLLFGYYLAFFIFLNLCIVIIHKYRVSCDI